MKINRGNFESNLIFLEKLRHLTADKRILEIGSGRGAMTGELHERGYQVTGTEINPEYRAFAKREYGIELQPVEGTALPFPDEAFDVAMSFDVFEHIRDTDRHLAEIRRVLKPDGWYLFSTPNKWTNIPFEILMQRSLTKYREYHVALHDYRGLKNRLKKNGFDCRFLDVPLLTPYFLEKIKKHLGRPGVWLVRLLLVDRWPMPFRTNFYVAAQKQKTENR